MTIRYALLPLVWILAAGAAQPPGAKLDLRLPPAPAHAASGETKCGACHNTESWGDVAFAHERTGFPLRGGHKRGTCKQCHPQSFSRPVSHECSACHRDAHRGQLGARCQGCHDEESWKSRFDADAHRRTGFPLGGRHAFIACEECHGNVLDRGFSRPVSACLDCHAKDLLRAGTIFPPHSSFGTACKDCHSPWRFTGAFFPAHERCFQIAGGPHGGMDCFSCHTSLAGATVAGLCNTATADCTRCHQPQTTIDAIHTGVLGYQYTYRKCYECHRFAAAGMGLRGLRSR